MNEGLKIQMINPTGRVVIVPISMKNTLLKQGFKIIINPKNEYYPQHDEKNSGFRDYENIIESMEAGNFLEVEKVC